MKMLLPSALISYTGCSEIEVRGDTLADVFSLLDQRFSGLRFRVIDEQNQFRCHIRCFVNAQQTVDLTHKLKQEDEILLMQALSGG